jgi:hypothetical protein
MQRFAQPDLSARRMHVIKKNVLSRRRRRRRRR